MIIDAHVNVTENGKWFNTNHNATLERLLDEMKEANIDKCLLISMPLVTTNRYIASVIDKHPNLFRGLAHINFTENIIKQINEIIEMGFAGIKIHPRMQDINCNNKDLISLWNKLNEINAVVMIDGYFQTNDKYLLLSELVPFQYEKLVKSYPNVTFIFSHFFAHRVLDGYYLAKSNKNVYLDCSHVLKYFEGSSLMQNFSWVMDKLDEKIIYGSDFPEYSLKDYKLIFEELSEKNKQIRKDLIFQNIEKIINFN